MSEAIGLGWVASMYDLRNSSCFRIKSTPSICYLIDSELAMRKIKIRCRTQLRRAYALMPFLFEMSTRESSNSSAFDSNLTIIYVSHI